MTMPSKEFESPIRTDLGQTLRHLTESKTSQEAHEKYELTIFELKKVANILFDMVQESDSIENKIKANELYGFITID